VQCVDCHREYTLTKPCGAAAVWCAGLFGLAPLVLAAPDRSKAIAGHKVGARAQGSAGGMVRQVRPCRVAAAKAAALIFDRRSRLG